MTVVQQKILKSLRGNELSVNGLISEVQKKSEASATTIKAAILPLILRKRIEMTAERKLRLCEYPRSWVRSDYKGGRE